MEEPAGATPEDHVSMCAAAADALRARLGAACATLPPVEWGALLASVGIEADASGAYRLLPPRPAAAFAYPIVVGDKVISAK